MIIIKKDRLHDLTDKYDFRINTDKNGNQYYFCKIHVAGMKVATYRFSIDGELTDIEHELVGSGCWCEYDLLVRMAADGMFDINKLEDEDE